MLKFAGVPLSIEDPEGRAQAWLDAYRPLDNILAPPPAYCDGRDRPQGNWGHAVGLPTFNWALRPPRWKLGTLWWPTGASRFAVGLFLATKSTAERMLAALGSDGSGTLEMADGLGGSISPTMYLLPPRPIGSQSAADPVVLIPLVDRRFFWQWAKAGQFFVSPTSTWADIRTAIISGLGVTITAPAPDGYEAPDWSEFDRWHENPALLLDGYAATVGQRFVAGLDGTYALQKWDAAQTIATTNVALANLAGGSVLNSAVLAPAAVSVVFPKRQGGIVHQNGTCDGWQKLATDYGFTEETAALGDVTIHSTYQSDRSLRGGSPDNQSNLEAVAGMIARDYYGWRGVQYFGCLPGIASNWTITGFDDYLWFFANAQHHPEPFEAPDQAEPEELPSAYLLQTLVEALPPNFGVEENLAQSPSPTAPRTFRPAPVWRAQLTSGWTDPGSSLPHFATARLLYDSSVTYPPEGTLAQDGFDVKIFDTCGIRGDVASGHKVWVAALAADTEMFELISTRSSGGGPKRFQLTADLSTGGSAAAVLRTWDGAAYINGDAITVFDWWSIPGGRGMWQGITGFEGWCHLRENETTEYDIVWMEQYARMVEFTLTSDFSAGTATATVTASWDQGVDPGATITVHDDVSEFTDAIIGCTGTALRSEYADAANPTVPYYKVVQAQRVALFLQATLTAPMCGSAPTVAAITPETQGQFVQTPGLANVTLNNSFNHYGMTGDAILLKRTFKTKAAGKWVYEVLDVTKHDYDVVLEWDIVGTTIVKLQAHAALEICAEPVETIINLVPIDYVANLTNPDTCDIHEFRRTALVFADAALEDGVILNMTEVTFVTEVTDGTTALNYKNRTGYVCSPGTESSDIEIVPIEDCP